jgi:3-phenylpropionate/cinnamic acid dioxygenase small subunit
MTATFTSEDRELIAELLHRYAFAVDDGDFDEVGRLFADATFHGLGDDRPLTGPEVAAKMKTNLILYEDGTPRTQHRISNVVISYDASTGRASSRCYVNVIQKVKGHPLEQVIAARYDDVFERLGSGWRFAERIASNHYTGDGLSRHTRAAKQVS